MAIESVDLEKDIGIYKLQAIFKIPTGTTSMIESDVVFQLLPDPIPLGSRKRYLCTATDVYFAFDGTVRRLFVDVRGLPGIYSIWLTDGPVVELDICDF